MSRAPLFVNALNCFDDYRKAEGLEAKIAAEEVYSYSLVRLAREQGISSADSRFLTVQSSVERAYWNELAEAA